jgi:hypothetical protein
VRGFEQSAQRERKETIMRLEDLHGEVGYRLAVGGTATAQIASGVRTYNDRDSVAHFGEPFRWAWNGKIHLAVFQSSLDAGQWWQL